MRIQPAKLATELPTGVDDRHPRWAWGIAVFVVLVVVLAPLQSTRLWWDLSRGRSVLSGHITPSRELVAAGVNADADWLGGVATAAAFGIAGTWGLFLIKAVVVSVTGLRLVGTPRFGVSWLIVVLSMLIGRGAWDVTSETVDLVMFAVCHRLVAAWTEHQTVRRLVYFLGAQLLWANAGPLSVFGFLIVCARGIDLAWVRRSARDWCSLLFLSLATACATPRLIETIRDSVLLAVPLTSVGVTGVLGEDWSPTWSSEWGPSATAWFIVSTLGWLIHIAGMASPGQVLLFTAIQCAGWSCRGNMAWAGWASAILISSSLAMPIPTGRRMLADLLRHRFATYLVCAAIVVIGWLGRESPRLVGNLLNSTIDPSLLAAALYPLKVQGTAHCTNTLSAGMLCWLKPAGPKPWITPAGALLNGSLPELAQLNQDLRDGRRDPYRRTDGRWGGWWTPLDARGTCLIIADSREAHLIRSLETTLWKPLLLDSPVLAFGKSGDPAVSPRIIEVLQQRHLVNSGNWVYQPTDLATDMRLARTLQAMQLPLAALRVVHASRRQHGNLVWLEDWTAIQRELAYRERLLMGRVSDWRQLVVRSLSARQRQPSSTETEVEGALDVQAPPAWMQMVFDAYWQGDVAAAQRLAHGESPDQLYVGIALAVEAGEANIAAHLRNQINSLHPQHPLTVLSSDVVE